MNIKSISIKNFRSIINIPKLPLDSCMTTLVGANEHGKSNILLAISCLGKDKIFDPNTDNRVGSTGKSFYPDINYEIEFSKEEREIMQGKIQELYPEREVEKDGVKNKENPEKVFKFRDVPSIINFRLYVVKQETGEEKVFYQIKDITYKKIIDDDIKKGIHEYVRAEAKNKFIYFDDFVDRLKSIITKDEMIKPDENLIIKGLLKTSGLLGFEEKIFTDDLQIRPMWDKAPQKITESIKKVWDQGLKDNINIKLTKTQDGQNIMVDVEDDNAYVGFESRSRGFKWFLSFFLKYRAHHDGDLADSIFIIDEPGLFLHPKG